MKKILSVMLCVVLSLALFAGCGEPSVEEALEGTWTKSMSYEGANIEFTLTFDDGRVKSQVFVEGQTSEDLTNEGSYVIGKTAVEVTYDNGNETEFEYYIEGGEVYIDILDGAVKK